MATIRKRGSKWQVQVRRKGQSSVSRSFSARKDAAMWAHQMEAHADRFDLPADPKALRRITLADLVERYRDTVTVRKQRREIETIVLNSFLRHPICRRSLSELHTADFAAYRDERLKVVQPSSLKRELVTIQNLFEVALHEWNLAVRENPIQQLNFKACDQRRERRLRNGEWTRLTKAAQQCRNSLVLPIMELAVETAMRRGELLSIHSDHIDFERRSLLIPQAKNGYARTIPLTPKASALLHSCRTEEGKLFPITPNAFRLTWERVKRRAGIDDLHFHDLRHEAISRFFEMGLTVPEVALISGHRDPRMLFRYTHPLHESIQSKLRDRA